MGWTMSNRTALGGYDVQSGSHIAPGARCDNFIQLAGAIPSRLRPRSHGPEAGMTMHSFPSRSALKLAQAADAVFNVFSGLFIAAFVLLLFASPFIAAFCLLFLSF